MSTLNASSADRNSVHNSDHNLDCSKDIAALAYSLWMDRGCPEGSPDHDWFRAEELAMTSDSSGSKSL